MTEETTWQRQASVTPTNIQPMCNSTRK